MSDIKSKEAILREAYERKYSSPTYDKSVNKQANFDYISPAMEEYAKQQSVAFLIDTTGDAHKHNAEQLYDKFLEHQSKQQHP